MPIAAEPLDEVIAITGERDVRVRMDPARRGRLLVHLDGTGIEGTLVYDELLLIVGACQRALQRCPIGGIDR